MNLLPPMNHISYADGSARISITERVGTALATAFDEILYARLGRDVDPKTLTGRGNIVQRGWDGDYHVTLDGKLIGVVAYPDIVGWREWVAYAIVIEAGAHESRHQAIGKP